MLVRGPASQDHARSGGRAPAPATSVPEFRHPDAGHSLVELMVGIVISMLAVAAGYTAMSSSDRAATVNDQTVQMQQNAQVAIQLLSQDLRTAGFGMSGAVGTCGQAIVPGDNNPAGADSGPDQVSMVVPTLLSTLAVDATGPALTVTLQAGAVAAMQPDGFAANATVSIGGVVSATVSAISGDALTLSPPITAPAVFTAGTQVYWLRCITYAIGTTTAACAGSAPCLLRGGAAVAEGIEDLQLAYACDGCNGTEPDGVIDDQPGSAAGFDATDFISNSTWATSPMTADTIRLVRVNVVARQTQSDPQWRSTTPVVVEDHDPAKDTGYSLRAYQQVRRRVLTRTVQVRNLGL